MMNLHHKGCGGQLYEDDAHPYEWDDEEGHHGPYPRLMCRKCGQELGGDAEIEEDLEEIQFGERKQKC